MQLCWQMGTFGDLCVLVTANGHLSCAAVKTGSVMGCISMSVAGKLREEVIILYLAVMRLSLECCDQFGALPIQERYYQNEACAAKGNWNGVCGIQGENKDSGLLQAKGLMDLTDVFSSSVGGYRVQVIGVSVAFGF